MSESSVRDRAAPVLEMENGPMPPAIDLAVGTAECLLRRARSTLRVHRVGCRNDCREPPWLRPAKSWGSGGLPKRVTVWRRPFNWLWQTAGTFEHSVETRSPCVEHQLSA